MAKPNHGQSVSAFAHQQQAAREDGGHPGIGQAVSEFAHNHGGGEVVDFADGKITLVSGAATTVYDSFADALAAAADGDTLQVGKGVYVEAIDLDKRVTIVGEEGAVLDGSSLAVSAGTQGTIELFDGFSGGSISGLTVIALDQGNALVSIIGEDIEGISLTGNTFDAGDNTAGPVVYLNPGVDGATIEGNSFLGDLLTLSPLLGVEGENVTVAGNAFGDTPETYAKVEVFEVGDATPDVVLTGNTGLDDNDVAYFY